jgi:hypothetical protein
MKKVLALKVDKTGSFTTNYTLCESFETNPLDQPGVYESNNRIMIRWSERIAQGKSPGRETPTETSYRAKRV